MHSAQATPATGVVSVGTGDTTPMVVGQRTYPDHQQVGPGSQTNHVQLFSLNTLQCSAECHLHS